MMTGHVTYEHYFPARIDRWRLLVTALFVVLIAAYAIFATSYFTSKAAAMTDCASRGTVAVESGWDWVCVEIAK